MAWARLVDRGTNRVEGWYCYIKGDLAYSRTIREERKGGEDTVEGEKRRRHWYGK